MPSDDRQYALRLANDEKLSSILNEVRRLAFERGVRDLAVSLDPVDYDELIADHDPGNPYD